MSTDSKPKTTALATVEGLSPLPVGQLDAQRPTWMTEADATQALAMANNVVAEVKANPADVRLMLRIGQLGNEGAERIAPNVALYNKHVNQLVTESQTGSPANLTLAELHQQVELVNPAVLKTKPIPIRFLGFAYSKKIPGAKEVLDMIYKNRATVQNTIDGLSKSLVVISDQLRANVEDLARIYEGLLEGQRLIERDIFVGQTALAELKPYLASLEPGPTRDNVEQFLADLTAQVVLLMDEENLNLQFFAGAQGVVKLTTSQLQNISGLGRMLRTSVIANLGLMVAAEQLDASMRVTEQMRISIGQTVQDTAERMEDMGQRMADMRAKGGVDLDKLEAGCKAMERFFAQQAKANEQIINEGAKTMNRLADMSSRLRQRAEGGHAGLISGGARE